MTNKLECVENITSRCACLLLGRPRQNLSPAQNFVGMVGLKWTSVIALPALNHDDPSGLQETSGAIFGKREMWKIGRIKAIQGGLDVSS